MSIILNEPDAPTFDADDVRSAAYSLIGETDKYAIRQTLADIRRMVKSIESGALQALVDSDAITRSTIAIATSARNVLRADIERLDALPIPVGDADADAIAGVAP